MPMYQAILFDLDGVLLDSEWLSYRIWKKYLWENEQYHLTREQYAEACGGSSDIFDRVMQILPGNKEDLNRYWLDEFNRYFAENDPPVIKGLYELLDFLRTYPGKKAIVTSSYGSWLQRYIDTFGLDQIFDRIFSGSMVEKTKPYPDLYQLACRTLQVEPQDCLAVEDSFWGIQAAQTAMVPVLHMQGVPILPEEIEKKCVGKVENLLEVLPYLTDNNAQSSESG